eukprot:COSAG01_NODE_8280_length_2846_cov_2.831452_3_plen_68_part_00
MQEGKIEEVQTTTEGFERLPGALLGLFAGRNVGKMIVREPIPAELQRLQSGSGTAQEEVHAVRACRL